MKLKERIFHSSKNKFVTWILIYLAFSSMTSLAFCDFMITGKMTEREAELELKKQELEAKLYSKGISKQDHIEELAQSIESKKHFGKQSQRNILFELFTIVAVLTIWAVPGTIFIYSKEINRKIIEASKINKFSYNTTLVKVAIAIAAICLIIGGIAGGIVYLPK